VQIVCLDSHTYRDDVTVNKSLSFSCARFTGIVSTIYEMNMPPQQIQRLIDS